MKVYLYGSAVVQLFMPALAGVWLGAITRTISSGLKDDQILSVSITLLSNGSNLLTGLLLGFVVFGLLSLTLSSAGSYLVAAMQTLAVDVCKRKTMEKYLSATTNDERHKIESDVLGWVKRNMPLASLSAVAVFASLYYCLDRLLPGVSVFQFQFVMYGAAITLLPVVLSQLVSPGKLANSTRPHPEGLWSILIGLAGAILPFVYAGFLWDVRWAQFIKMVLPRDASAEAMINLTPVFGCTASTIAFVTIRIARTVFARPARS